MSAQAKGAKMNKPRVNPGGNSVHVGGNVTGNITVGEGNVVHIINNSGPDDVGALRKALEVFKQEVSATAPPEEKEDAASYADMMANAALAKTPNATILSSCRDWFVEHVPAVAESVASILGHPLLGRVLGAAGRALGG
jgi:hypothetical protein